MAAVVATGHLERAGAVVRRAHWAVQGMTAVVHGRDASARTAAVPWAYPLTGRSCAPEPGLTFVHC